MINDIEGVHERFFGEGGIMNKQPTPTIQVRPGKRTLQIPPPIQTIEPPPVINIDAIAEVFPSVPELHMPEFEQAIQQCIQTGQSQQASSRKQSEVTQVFRMDYEPGPNPKAKSCEQYTMAELGLAGVDNLSAVEISQAIDRAKQHRSTPVNAVVADSLPVILEPVSLNCFQPPVYNLEYFIDHMPDYYKSREGYWNMKEACRLEILDNSPIYKYFNQYLEQSFVKEVIEVNYSLIDLRYKMSLVQTHLRHKYGVNGIKNDAWANLFLHKNIAKYDALAKDTHDPITGARL